MTKTTSARFKGNSSRCSKERNVAFWFLLLAGIGFVAFSFASELYFHYVQGFRPGLVDDDVFWRAEYAEVFNSMAFLLVGVAFVVLAIVVKRKE